MTTKPTARKFRIKRATPVTHSETARSDGSASADAPQQATAAQAPAAGAQQAPMNVALELDAIRREGLTGRQLRMARRVAQKNGLAPTSDIDAVRLLRKSGVDPFQHSNMLELVVPKEAANASGAENEGQKARIQLPQTVPTDRETLPSTDVSPMERRNREISEIQKDISRRRRKKMRNLAARLAFFVFHQRFWQAGTFSGSLPLCTRPSQSF